MNIIEKLIEKLDIEITDTYYKSVEGNRYAGIENNAYHNIKRFVMLLVEEYKNDFCKWKEKGNYFVTECSNETDVMYEIKDNYIYCPYCGKKIKKES